VDVMLVRLLSHGHSSSFILFSFFLMTRRPPTSTLFPCTTLFRSHALGLEHPHEELSTSRRSHWHPIDVTGRRACRPRWRLRSARSEEHTSELQSRENLVCRLLLEKKKQKKIKLSIIMTSRTNTTH